MIADHLEPKGLARDAKPLLDTLRVIHFREDATEGSARLRDAILLARGIDPQPIRKARKVAHTPHSCPLCGGPVKPRLLIAHIQATVAKYYGIPTEMMVSAQRSLPIAHPRQIAMYLSSKLTPKSLPEIGRRFGGRDHTTVIHAIKAVTRRIAEDPEIECDVEALTERLSQ